MLNETQILLLDNLIYLNEFKNPDSYLYHDGNMKAMLEKIDVNKCDGNCKMSAAEWQDIINMALSDEKICNMQVSHRSYEKETGAGMACFFDPEEGQAYAVFAGTGANEWRDDCVAGTMADSPQQEKALAWFENLPYDNITVSGHSKGGNKAMYTAVVSDKAGECYAFDGEGFSNEFCEKYASQIERKASQIHLRSNSRDYVNVLLNCIAGDVKYIYNNDGISNAAEYHQPNALFKYKDGKATYNLGELTNYQDPTMEMLHNFTVYLLNNAPEAEKILVLSVLGELLTKFVGGEKGVVREDIIGMFGIEGIEITLRYLTKYLQDLRITDPLTFLKYEDAFWGLASDTLGGGIWLFVLFECLLLPPTDHIFDWIASGGAFIMYGTAVYIAGANVRGRDFSKETMEQMLGAAKETEEEDWWRVDRWDCWYKLEKFFGFMQWDYYTGRVDEYYRKLIDMNDASVKDIERIFTQVYEIDGTYGQRMAQAVSSLSSEVLTPIKNMAESIVPAVK